MTATTSARELAMEIAEAHGGTARWRRSAAVDVRFSARGLAFLFKGQPETLSTVVGRFGTRSQSVTLQGATPDPWRYETSGSAELLDDVRRIIRERRRRWSIPDVATFAATAMWTYLNLPYVLLDPGVGLEMLPSNNRRIRRLRVRFPPELATHSSDQVLHVNPHGLISRHDYAARMIGDWAAGSQALDGYQNFDGVRFATRRRVTPRVRGHVLPVPTLVQIEVHDMQLVAE